MASHSNQIVDKKYAHTFKEVIINLESEINQIQSRILDVVPRNSRDKSLGSIIQENETKFKSALDLIKRFPGVVDVYNEDHGSIMITETIEREITELNLLRNSKENIEGVEKMKELASLDVHKENNENISEEDLVSNLKRTMMELKEGLEYVLETLYPDEKGNIKEILSTLEGTSKKAKNEGERWFKFVEPHLLSALELLVKANIIELRKPFTYKLTCLDN